MLLVASEQGPRIEQQRAEVEESVTRILPRAQAAGGVRDDLTFEDCTMLMGADTATMHHRYSTAGSPSSDTSVGTSRACTTVASSRIPKPSAVPSALSRRSSAVFGQTILLSAAFTAPADGKVRFGRAGRAGAMAECGGRVVSATPLGGRVRCPGPTPG